MPIGRREFFIDREERNKEEQHIADLTQAKRSFEKNLQEAGEKIADEFNKKHPDKQEPSETA